VFKGKKIHIVSGAGTEGVASAIFLSSLGAKIFLHDFREGEDFKRAFHEYHTGISAKERVEKFQKISKFTLLLGKNYLSKIENADLIVVPQSFRLYSENQKLIDAERDKFFEFKNKSFEKQKRTLQRSKIKTIEENQNRKIPFKIIDDFYFEFFKNPIIGITGTNGKTTIKRWITSLFETFGKKVLSSGNDRGGEQMLPKIFENFNLNQGKKFFNRSSSKLEIQNLKNSFDFEVLELSHRKLQFLDKSPNVAVVSNISEDHLDETKTFENYVSWKENIAKFQTKDDFLVLNFDDKFIRERFEKFSAKKIYFSYYRFEKFPGVFLNGNMITLRNLQGEEKIIGSVCDLNLVGIFNQLNLLATIASAIPFLELDFSKISNWIKTLKPPENRLQIFGYLDEFDIFYSPEELKSSFCSLEKVQNSHISGFLTIFNNLISRTPDSTEKAIESIGRSLLICGGDEKNANLESLAKKILDFEIFVIFLSGSGSIKLSKILENMKNFNSTNKNFLFAENFLDAMEKSKKICRENSFDKILISPTFAGFQSKILNGKGLESFIK